MTSRPYQRSAIDGKPLSGAIARSPIHLVHRARARGVEEGEALVDACPSGLVAETESRRGT